MTDEKIGILGGGLAGISFAHYLDKPCTILEKNPTIGGLCRSIKFNNDFVDYGAHIIFSKHAEILDDIKALLKDNLQEYERKAYWHWRSMFVEYPFENGFYALDDETRCQIGLELLAGYVNHRQTTTISNFQEWLITVYGYTVANEILIPYNRKLWKTDLTNIALDWTGRIPCPDFLNTVKAIAGIKTIGNKSNSTFLYPIEGGIQSLITALAKNSQATIETDCNVYRVRKHQDKYEVVASRKGSIQVFEFDKIICCMPLPELIFALQTADADILQACNSLAYRGLKIKPYQSNGSYPSDAITILDASENTEWHRLCNYEYIGGTTYVAEYTGDYRDDTTTTQYAYIIYNETRAENVALIKAYCKSLDIPLLGRFAEWEYINMDEVMSRAKQKAKEWNES